MQGQCKSHHLAYKVLQEPCSVSLHNFLHGCSHHPAPLQKRSAAICSAQLPLGPPPCRCPTPPVQPRALFLCLLPLELPVLPSTNSGGDPAQGALCHTILSLLS